MKTMRRIIAWTLLVPLMLVILMLLVVFVALNCFGELGLVPESAKDY